MSEVNEPAAWRAVLPWPDGDTHKHARGRLGVIAGGPLRTGAARLVARAGLRIGAGVVKVLCPPESAAVLAPVLEAALLDSFTGEDELETLARPMHAVVIGPAAGVTDATMENLEALQRTGAALVVDADALTVFRESPGDLFGWLDRDDVLTPHAAEFERLFPGLLAEQGRIGAAVRAAAQAGAVVVLKGQQTVIAAPDGRVRLNQAGAPWLATAGSGDVLAGMIGGLLAQAHATGMDSFDAASAAVWLHAEAARRFGPGLIAEDLPDALPPLLAELYPGG